MFESLRDDEEYICDGCGECESDCMCWLDEECQRCGELNYRCECDKFCSNDS